MSIHTADFVAGAASARGVAIVIDVFRACSLYAHALAAGAETIIPVERIDEAQGLKAHHPQRLLVGERHERRLPEFDCGNSRSEVLAVKPAGRGVIHTTHTSAQGLMSASRVVSYVFTGAFVTMSAAIAAVRALAPEEATIVAMGHEARERREDDDLCREAMIAALEGHSFPLANLPYG